VAIGWFADPFAGSADGWEPREVPGPSSGLLATAKHVVENARGQLLADLAGLPLLRNENRVIVREVKLAHSGGDVAVGFLRDRRFDAERVQTVNPAFAFTNSALRAPGLF
jgi:hypothetical protein